MSIDAPGMIFSQSRRRRTTSRRIIARAMMGLAALLATGLADPACAMRRREAERAETVAARPLGEPLMAIVSLGHQRITIYDADGWILRAPVSSGQAGYETPAGIYSVLQKEADHYSNIYDDASMPFMQRITWSGIALHAGQLPGYPASHGCVRMPYDFAQKLFAMTKLGMRVIVTRNDVRPAEIEHPLLFKPPTPSASLQSIAAAKSAEANAATKKANDARFAAARMAGEAARLLPAANGAKARAEAQLVAAEHARDAASSPLAVRLAEEALTRASLKLAEAEAQLDAAQTEAPLKAEAAERAREEARTAEAEKVAALEAAAEAKRRAAPISVLISRKTERLYVRQAFEEVFESPVTIRDPGEPIGTHLYTAVETANGVGLRWSVVSLGEELDERPLRPKAGSEAVDAGPARTALDRIDIPQDIADRVSELIAPGSSLIVSDEGISSETGKDTDFVILMSGEPHGAIKARHREPRQAQARDERPTLRSYRREPAYPPPYYWGGGTFGSW